MPNRTVQNTEIKPNQTILLRGKVTWARIVSFIDGEELTQKTERLRAMGFLNPVSQKHTSIAIEAAQLVPATKGVMTPEETYVMESCFKKNTANRTYQGLRYSIDNKSSFLPAVATLGDPASGEEPTAFYQRDLDNDPAAGTDVLLVLRTFAGQMGHNGVGLDAVLILTTLSKLEYRGDNGTRLANTLAARGIVYHQDESKRPSIANPSDPRLDLSRVPGVPNNGALRQPPAVTPAQAPQQAAPATPFGENYVPNDNDDTDTYVELDDPGIEAGIVLDSFL